MIVCKYCCKSRENEFFECYRCGECVHPRCLRNCKVPGNLLGDVFFSFVCTDCSSDGTDKLERDKMAWVDVVLLALYNLTHTSSNQSIHGFFHCNKHIKKFVDNHWKTLFPYLKTKRKSYKQMITSALKNYCPEYFTCGDGSFDFPSGLVGWYKLTRPNTSPADALFQRREKKKKRRWEPDQGKFCYQNEDSLWGDSSSRETDNFSSSNISSYHMFCSDNSVLEENMYSRSYVKPSASLSEYLFAEEDAAEDVDVDVTDSESVVDIRCKESSSDGLVLPVVESSLEGTKNEIEIKREPCEETTKRIESDQGGYLGKRPYKSDESLLVTNKNSKRKPWLRPHSQSLCYEPLNENEENYLSSSLGKRIFEPEEVSLADIRLHRKLRVRKLKRERNLPVFDLCTFEESRCSNDGKVSRVRILDRYQHQTVFASGENELSASFRTRLMGHTEQQQTCFRSPFTRRLLKPFIRRDYESLPLWPKLLEELRSKVNGKDKTRGDTGRAPIDYSYVRPQHIPAVNSLASQYFWPGINLSECLQYPDFSCVVLYKKLIVAFAFLVPDVGYNEAYISFIFTRPEWRRAGIGTFMLYHLIQTCMGKDITLHVSATNSALFLYQRFGFKVEEFIQDFYEKYLPADSNECRHALFLRLCR